MHHSSAAGGCRKAVHRRAAPLIRELLTRDVQFLVGSNYNIILAQLRADAPQLEIYFACGAALAEEYPEMTRLGLFHQADENMYQNKQQWYAEKKARESQTAKELRRNPQPQNIGPHDGYTGQKQRNMRHMQNQGSVLDIDTDRDSG